MFPRKRLWLRRRRMDNSIVTSQPNSADSDSIRETNLQEENVSFIPYADENSVNNISSTENDVIDDFEGLQRELEPLILSQDDDRKEVDLCKGRYIYVHDLPSRFNNDLLKQCKLLDKWSDMCHYLDNMGLGSRLGNPQRLFLSSGWFETHQFSLEVVFHNRMKQYECLTNDSSLATAIFVPYYSGLDIARYLWGHYNVSVRDWDSRDLVKWLREKPEWSVMDGKNHFLVAGRITWDFRRAVDDDSGWGNKLMFLQESQNMTMLTIESSPWHRNDFAIPYPTYFHPSSDNEVVQWQNKMRRQKRRALFCFAGAPRPNMEDSIRSEIMEQCSASKQKCRLLECKNDKNKCMKPVHVMKLFQNSVFCLQPSGDSFTRRSTFDSILAGCIPVFFSPGSAYVQYLWHLPKDYPTYSVLIPEDDVKQKKSNIDKILSQIPGNKISAMREEVIKLIPKVIYNDPRSRLKTFKDAFDLTIKGVLDRVETLRKEVREGRNSSSDFDEENSWKYYAFGNTKEHEWDNFFRRTNRVRY
ncbi:Exostosin family protein [Abeliophyllum distichum]|uniref:Exostosin family protein n=1 Tax=Abeliophyllum distichum TaxID=126358 RepID=A0ABD1SHH8_9LAMI